MCKNQRSMEFQRKGLFYSSSVIGIQKSRTGFKVAKNYWVEIFSVHILI